MHEVFISYSSKDQKIADAIVNILESDKVRCWIAYRDAEVGGAYAASIVNAIKSSKIFLLVFSENSNASKHVLREVDAACKYEKTIIPFKIKDIKMDDAMEYYLNSTHWLDAINAPMEGHLKSLAALVNKYIGKADTTQNLHTVQSSQTHSAAEISSAAECENEFSIVFGKQVTVQDIEEAVGLDKMVYDAQYHLQVQQCLDWYAVNPDIYVMAKKEGRVIAYINISPVTDECYAAIRSGEFIDTAITADMILSYDMPFPCNIYFSSIVIHPDYQNTRVSLLMFNTIVERFLSLGEQEVFIKKMIADAATPRGEKLCKLFGMTKIDATTHDSTLYEVSMIPPKFRITSGATKRLYDYYSSKYEAEPYLFDEPEF